MIKKANSQSEITTEIPLEDKVALLFDGAHSGGRSLAVSLAEYGADVAIVYRQAHARNASITKELVEAKGRRCLIIPAQGDEESFSRDVVQQTINTLGRLDIFIDYSSLPREDVGADQSGKTEKRDNNGRTDPFTNVEIMSAALDQMVNVGQINNQDNETNPGIKRRSDKKMRVAKEFTNKPVISINEGIEIGKVQDFYLDQDLTHLTAIYLGSEGLLSRTETLIKWSNVVTLGQDAILVKDANSEMETVEVEEIDTFIRRDDIEGRPVDTPGGTKIGRIGDIVLDEAAKVTGFSLSQTYVSGPIAANKAISRTAVVDTGNEDGMMTANLSEAEKADLQVVYEGFFAEPSVSPTESEEASTEA
jgi:sporulation protein YlmC with PRC-barrel domain